MDFSIVIPVLNEAVYLEGCLRAQSLLQYPSDGFQEIVLTSSFFLSITLALSGHPPWNLPPAFFLGADEQP